MGDIAAAVHFSPPQGVKLTELSRDFVKLKHTNNKICMNTASAINANGLLWTVSPVTPIYDLFSMIP